ncbi:uncharacterized protein LOC125200631 [Salvia hispanica]|uniref:uncharacterized protein LOC125200631 n=1 Tax=Salvia hispanica TaxID=49212 RepID=UPI00200985DB|nr:uncharacterized protein LOC125200631 [Salvia hispanica]XP_047954273.1 uncharacterized protein LOC125200631 [Salvia hispanica]XP_047954274.1 uncharacterized protein LOC125200631 [Salvia hispanica]
MYTHSEDSIILLIVKTLSRDNIFFMPYIDYLSLLFFRLPSPREIIGYHRLIINSVNGLLLLWDGPDNDHHILFIVNPMTCEYVELPPQPRRKCLFGFRVSKLSGKYKISCVDESSSCYLYALGGVLWRSISTTTRLPNKSSRPEYIQTRLLSVYILFFKGNLHWFATDYKANFVICCFDLETEVFTSFSPPPRQRGYFTDTYGSQQLCVLNDQLGSCDITDHREHIIAWKMNNYQDSHSWVIEYTIARIRVDDRTLSYYIILPLKVFAIGDLLFAIKDQLLIHSKATKVMVPYVPLQRSYYENLHSTFHYTPNFLTLKIMGISNVQSISYLLGRT